MAINDGYKELMEQVPHYKNQNSFGDDFFAWETHNTINGVFPYIPIPNITKKRIKELEELYGYTGRDIKRLGNRCGMWRNQASNNYRKLKKDNSEKESVKHWPTITIRPTDLCKIFHVTEDYLFGYTDDPKKKIFETWEELYNSIVSDYDYKNIELEISPKMDKKRAKYVCVTKPELVDEVNQYRSKINDLIYTVYFNKSEELGLDEKTLRYVIKLFKNGKEK